MKKKIMMLLAITCLAIMFGAVQAQAAYTGMTGSTSIGATGSTTNINFSTYVYCDYVGSAQQYAAACHNKAGDKVYATGGGGANANGIYYKQNPNYIGCASVPDSPATSDSTFTGGTGWTAQ